MDLTFTAEPLDTQILISAMSNSSEIFLTGLKLCFKTMKHLYYRENAPVGCVEQGCMDRTQCHLKRTLSVKKSFK